MKKKGFTLIELLVVIAIIAMLLAILMPALNKVKRLAQRLVCATNLKGLGTAMIVYSNDFDDEYPVQGGGYDHTWADRTSGYAALDKDWAVEENITAGASLFLLVREADVSTKSFVCKSSDQKPYEGEVHAAADDGQELVELWDFGHIGQLPRTGPQNCVSYAYQIPYDVGFLTPARFFPADAVGPAGMALMADRNPWYDPKLNVPTTGTVDSDSWESFVDNIENDWDFTGIDKYLIQVGNAFPHNREGQNALFNDGHSEFVKRSDVGYENDNIYTPWGVAPGVAPDEEQVRIGGSANIVNTGGSKANRDSWLINDCTRP